MSQTDLQALIDFVPFTPLRLTLASGDVVELLQRQGLGVSGLGLTIEDTGWSGRPRLRNVSIPNICLIEPLLDPGTTARGMEGAQ